MDSGLIRTVPSALAGAATGLGYAHDVMVLLSVSQYIRNLGYSAVPTMNDTALAIPYAIKAGLGEYGRHGLVITPEFGPRVRFGKIFTDLPLVRNPPIRQAAWCRRAREECVCVAVCRRMTSRCGLAWKSSVRSATSAPRAARRRPSPTASPAGRCTTSPTYRA